MVWRWWSLLREGATDAGGIGPAESGQHGSDDLISLLEFRIVPGRRDPSLSHIRQNHSGLLLDPLYIRGIYLGAEIDCGLYGAELLGAGAWSSRYRELRDQQHDAQ